jgi:hypothetical protein
LTGCIFAAGRVVLDTPLPIKSNKNCRISSITPIAVSLSERTQFVVRGFNIVRPVTRLFLCSLFVNILLTFYENLEINLLTLTIYGKWEEQISRLFEENFETNRDNCELNHTTFHFQGTLCC